MLTTSSVSKNQAQIFIYYIFIFRGGLAVGFFGNEEGNKGVQSTVDALQDTNDTLSNSVKTVSNQSSR